MVNKNSFVGLLISALLFQVLPANASSWNPALLVNTETFQTIDDSDTASDLYVRFGDSLNKRLTFERTLDRFNFNDDVYISGNITTSGTASGKIIHAQDTLSSSGSIVWEGAASGASLWVSTFQGAGLTSCNADGETLGWNSTSKQFECGDDDGGVGSNYYAAQGLSLASSFFRLNESFSGTALEIIGTASGRTIFANDTLASSGNLIVESLVKQASGAIATTAAEYQTGAYLYASGASVLALESYTQHGDGSQPIAPSILFGYKGVFDTDLFRSSGSTLRTNDQFLITTTDEFNRPSLQIDSEESTASQVVFDIYSDVNGSDDRIFRFDADGNAYADGAWNGNGADLAEWFPSEQTDLVAGELVCLDPANPKQVMRCSGANPFMIGVISTAPSFIGASKSAILAAGKTPALVGFMGQVPTKVTDNVAIGDPIGISSTNGVGKRVNPGQRSVCTALEPHSGAEVGNINCLLPSLQWSTAEIDDDNGNLDIIDANRRFLKKQGGTMTGALAIRPGPTGTVFAADSGLGLEIVGSASGRSLHAQDTLSSSGGLIVDGDTLTKGNLTINSDNDGSSPQLTFGGSIAETLQFNAAIGRFEFTDDLLVDGGLRVTGSTNIQGTASGSIVHANLALRSSGSLTVEGAVTLANFNCSGNANGGALTVDANGVVSCSDDDGGVGSGLTQTSGDARYVLKQGATMTGALTIDLNGTAGNGTSLIVREKASFGSGATLSGSLVLREHSTPARQDADVLAIYNREYANRSLLNMRNRNGPGFSVQPAFFSNNISMVMPNVTTTMTALGGGVTASATLSHPTPTEALPYATNYATSTTSGNESGWMHTNPQYFRGSTSGFNGFFYRARVIVIDTALVRLFAGLSSQTTLANMFGSDDVTGHRAGFRYSTVTSDTTWKVTLKNNVTQNLIDTGVTVAANNVYDLILYSPGSGSPDAGTMFWEVINMTSGASRRGSAAQNLPGGSTALRAAMGVETQTTVAKSFRMVNTYIETESIR